jgi:hypothetical protein
MQLVVYYFKSLCNARLLVWFITTIKLHSFE